MFITPYRPSHDLFGPVFEEFFRPLNRWAGSMDDFGLVRTPDADVIETEDEIQVAIELPGMRSDDIHLDLEKNVLTVSGEKKETRTEEGDRWHLWERRYGRFSRSFVLPRDVEHEEIQAHYEDGVLKVRIPKSERARPRRIPVWSGNGQKEVEAGSTAAG